MKTERLYYGAAYYDEYMPCERIEKDMEMMERAGMNVIRIAESTWSTWEPREGEYDFTHLHRMLDAAKRHRLSVIVGTPTYAIPAWLAKKDPTILALTHQGQELYGRRQNMDITNPTYLHHAQIIIEKLMEEVKDEPHVIGFQLDNETNHYDTCTPHAQQMFVEYLKKQFPDIRKFNQKFGLDYWSNRVDDWENFPDIRGTINYSLGAEYVKFQRQLVTDFLAWQRGIVEKYKRPEQFITQNFDFEWHDYSYGLQPKVNQFEAGNAVTVAGCDIYHPSQDLLTGCEATLCGNIARGIKGSNYLILETQAQGNPQWLPYPGQMRLSAYTHIANGANSVLYWHWHSIHNAIESYWKGVLSHDLAENDAYRSCCEIGNEWKRIGDKLKNLDKRNRIAMIADNASLTGMTYFPTETGGVSSYNEILRWMGDTLLHMNIEYDIIPADKNLLEKYDYVVAPALYSATEDFLTGLLEYVEKGGNLIATFKSGFSDEHIKIYAHTQPHILYKALGLHYDRFTYPKEVTVSFAGKSAAARQWMELISCDSASPLCFYEHKAWKDYCAAAQNTYGSGHTLYLGTMMGEEVLTELLGDFLTKTQWKEPDKLPFEAAYPISVKQGINEEGRHILYFLNYSDETADVRNIAGDATELRSGRPVPNHGTFSLSPWGVAILEY